MYGPILSALLVGMIPVWGVTPVSESPLSEVHVAAPLRSSGSLSLPPLSASGVLVMDLDSAQTIYAAGDQTPRAMASLTKLMTALLIAENHEIDEWVTVSPIVRSMTGSLAWLPVGQEFTVGDLLSGLILNSGNDAAVALAEFHSGSVEAFVQAMNARSIELGLKNTTFANPIGFDDPNQKASARDLAWLAMFAMRRPEILERMSTGRAEIVSKTGKRISLKHTHQLLHQVSTIIAGKTGTTEEAKQCLLSVVQTPTRRLLVVLLHSSNRYADMRAIESVLTTADL